VRFAFVWAFLAPDGTDERQSDSMHGGGKDAAREHTEQAASDSSAHEIEEYAVATSSKGFGHIPVWLLSSTRCFSSGVYLPFHLLGWLGRDGSADGGDRERSCDRQTERAAGMLIV